MNFLVYRFPRKAGDKPIGSILIDADGTIIPNLPGEIVLRVWEFLVDKTCVFDPKITSSVAIDWKSEYHQLMAMSSLPVVGYEAYPDDFDPDNDAS